MNYTDDRSLDKAAYQYTAKTKDSQFVYGTEEEILKAGAEKCSYAEGEAAGNDWDSLSQARRQTTYFVD
jgi:hypothetical protein